MFQSIFKGVNIQQIIGLEFWFSNGGLASVAELIFWLSNLFTIIAAGIFGLLYNRFVIGHYPPKNRIFKPAAIGLIVIGFGGVVFSSFRWQGIDFLGVRVFLLVTIVAAIVWAAIFYNLYRKKIPDESVKYEAGILKQKYLSK